MVSDKHSKALPAWWGEGMRERERERERERGERESPKIPVSKC